MSKELVTLNNLAAYLLAPEEENDKKYDYNELADILREIKQALTSYAELERDVKRFMELLNKDPKSTTNRESFEVVTLGEKLSKVGKEE